MDSRPLVEILAAEEKDFGVLAAASVAPYQTEFFGSRALADTGNRAFFEAFESLSPADTNGKTDVYEWEATGIGTCSPTASGYSAQAGGCVTLISSGRSTTNSEFVDADPSGKNVFFATGESLVPQDPGLIDIYDARQEGGFASPAGTPAECEGQGCQAQSAALSPPSFGSAALVGPGNVNAKHKKHHKKGRPKHRKVKKKHEEGGHEKDRGASKKQMERTGSNWRADR